VEQENCEITMEIKLSDIGRVIFLKNGKVFVKFRANWYEGNMVIPFTEFRQCIDLTDIENWNKYITGKQLEN
jgi:hypothetical protein